MFFKFLFFYFSGVIVPGGFGKRGMEGKIEACKWCRTNDKPFLGVCLGMQAAVIEFARNVLNLCDANSTEINSQTENPIVIDMPEHNPGQMGGTMRLGKRITHFTRGSSAISSYFWLLDFLLISILIFCFFSKTIIHL